MKEAQIFENWINNMSEGTWSLPETPEQLNQLKELMATELIVGPDATNATEQLYDLVGDDILFDRLSALAEQDPRANVWDDTEVMDRLTELGIDLPEPTDPMAQEPALDAEAEPTAEPVPVAEAGPRAVDDQGNPIEKSKNYSVSAPVTSDQLKPGSSYSTAKGVVTKTDTGLIHKARSSSTPTPRGVEESAELDAMLKYAGIPVVESILDESGETIDHILNRFKHEVSQFEAGADLDSDLYDALYDYYSDKGEIPYGIAKGRTGDPFEWVTDRLDQELGTGNHAPRLPEADSISTFEVMSGFDAPVAEASCNMTREGEYCPDHGLSECGSGMYESRESDAVLARIKSLALLK